ncbi:hypothetical protein PPYR_06316 [Photinus pyralis]|uniref:EB domain-containing protein n=1 Tax=Photinus pyralis TaxID=7054 RepID=A0A5N4ATD7_PHOPY|nr:fibrillin-2-like [Photinus pyralis]KAB0800576.1 hypothetical protein PPYR_06316 [Photinus pyralis]
MKVTSEIAIILVLTLLCLSCGSSTKVQERILSFYTCKYDIDCVENAFCYWRAPEGGKCRCKENFVLVQNKTSFECLAVATGIDSPCIENIQCEMSLGNLAECNASSNKCQCIDVAHLGRDDKCHRTIALGGICETNDNCLLGDESYGFCYVGKCICNVKYHISSDGKRCIPSSFLQQSCESAESCAVTAFSDCYGGICKCIEGYIEAEDFESCLKAASAVGDNCTQTIQCSEYIKGSFCDNNKCTCKTGYHGYGNECTVDAKLGEACKEDKECILTANLENSVRCTLGVCTCVVGLSSQEPYGCVINSAVLKQYYPSLIMGLILALFLINPH